MFGEHLERAGLVTGYSLELVGNMSRVDNLAQGLPISEETSVFLRNYSRSSFAATMVLSGGIHDVATEGMCRKSMERRQVEKIGGMMITLTDIVDSQIDQPGLPATERESYLNAGIEQLLFGKKPTFACENNSKRASFDIAKALHSTVVRHDHEARFATVFNNLIPAVLEQFYASEPHEYIDIAIRIGRGCGMLSSAAVEHVYDKPSPDAQIAAAAIGAYAQCLDHAYEIESDLQDGARTYPTMYISRYGDTPTNRKLARSHLIDAGTDTFNGAWKALSAKQRNIIGAMRFMLDARYRVLKQSMDSIKYFS